MHTRFISIVSLVLGLGVIAACSVPVSSADTSKPRTSATYALHAGEVVRLGQGTTLKLDRVNDSRCRKGAACVWEGYISYSFTLQDRMGNSKRFVLSEKMPNAAPTITQDGLTFTLANLDPPEPPALDAPAPDYRVSLRVNITRPT